MSSLQYGEGRAHALLELQGQNIEEGEQSSTEQSDQNITKIAYHQTGLKIDADNIRCLNAEGMSIATSL